MTSIKPSEISSIIREELSNTNFSGALEETGTVLEVGDGIARVYGLSNAQYGELVSFDSGLEGMVLNLEEDNVGVVLFGSSEQIKEGDRLKRTKKLLQLKLAKKLLEELLTLWGTL